MRDLVVNRRAATEWTVSQVIVVVLSLILLVVFIYGLVTGGLQPVFEYVGGKIDGILILFGLMQQDSLPSQHFAPCVDSSVNLDFYDGLLTFKECYSQRSGECYLIGFESDRYYRYNADLDNEQLAVYEPEVGTFREVSETNSVVRESSGVYSAAIAFVYSLFGEDSEYSIDTYLSRGMGTYFGEMGDLFIVHGSGGSVLMEQDGLFVVFDYSQYLDGQSIGVRLISPLSMTRYSDEQWVRYVGRDRARAMNALYAMTDGWVFDDTVYVSTCTATSFSNLQENCLSSKVASSNGDLLLGDFFVRESLKQDGDNELDSSAEVALLVKYFSDVRFRYVSPGIVQEESVERLNQLIGGRTFAVGDETFMVVAEPNSGLEYGTVASAALPVLHLRGQNNEYYLRFVGANAYYEGEISMFLNDGGAALRVPFVLYDSNKVPLAYDPDFFVSDEIRALDLEVFSYMRTECIWR